MLCWQHCSMPADVVGTQLLLGALPPDLLHALLPVAATAECILRDEPLPDLHAGATSLSGLLRSGLGRLGVKVGRAETVCR